MHTRASIRTVLRSSCMPALSYLERVHPRFLTSSFPAMLQDKDL